MYARVTQFQMDPAREAEAIATFDAVSGRVKALPGVISAYTSWRSEDGHGVTTAIYESQAAAEAVASEVQSIWSERGGPRFSDRLLRWSPDPTGGIWNATKETELPG